MNTCPHCGETDRQVKSGKTEGVSNMLVIRNQEDEICSVDSAFDKVVADSINEQRASRREQAQQWNVKNIEIAAPSVLDSVATQH